jgi:uncharacterized protein YihD (DUF1040 family)
MRDPERIDEVLAQVRRAWMANPDLRLTQLVFNAARAGAEDGSMPSVPVEFYNAEEPQLIHGLAALAAT